METFLTLFVAVATAAAIFVYVKSGEEKSSGGPSQDDGPDKPWEDFR